jgi:hypothetical protein
MTHFLQSDSTSMILTGGSESEDSFEAKLIAAKCIRCRSTANKDFEESDQAAKCSTSSAIPAPKLWRRSSKKQQDAVFTSALQPEILEPSEVHQDAVPCLLAESAEMDEWARSFFSLVGLNEI